MNGGDSGTVVMVHHFNSDFEGDGDGGVQPWRCGDLDDDLHRGDRGDGHGDPLLPLALCCLTLPELEGDTELGVGSGQDFGESDVYGDCDGDSELI